TSLASVAAAAERLAAFTRLDGIFLNGGPMQFSGKGRTVDGLPPLLGSHVVANVVLVSWLLPLLSEQGSEPGRGRIVHASSSFVKLLPMRLDNLDRMPRTGIAAYVKAKAATEVFAYELDRRIRAAGLPVSSILTHPGMGVDAKTPRRTGVRDETVRYQRSPYVLWAQGKDAAAWSGVRALTDPSAQGGEYYGPARGTRGEPIRIDTNSASANPTSANAADVWSQVTDLSGARPTPSPPRQPYECAAVCPLVHTTLGHPRNGAHAIAVPHSSSDLRPPKADSWPTRGIARRRTRSSPSPLM